MNILIMLLILQWNAQSLLTHGNELKHALDNWNDKPDIIRIQETWLKKGKTSSLDTTCSAATGKVTPKPLGEDVLLLPKKA